MQFSGSRSPLLILVSYMYVNYADCGTALQDQPGQFDSSGIIRGVYISTLCKFC